MVEELNHGVLSCKKQWVLPLVLEINCRDIRSTLGMKAVGISVDSQRLDPPNEFPIDNTFIPYPLPRS